MAWGAKMPRALNHEDSKDTKKISKIDPSLPFVLFESLWFSFFGREFVNAASHYEVIQR